MLHPTNQESCDDLSDTTIQVTAAAEPYGVLLAPRPGKHIILTGMCFYSTANTQMYLYDAAAGGNLKFAFYFPGPNLSCPSVYLPFGKGGMDFGLNKGVYLKSLVGGTFNGTLYFELRPK